jgi:hypothetical protein
LYIDGNAKSFRLKSYLEEDFVAAFYFSEAPLRIQEKISPDPAGFGYEMNFEVKLF